MRKRTTTSSRLSNKEILPHIVLSTFSVNGGVTNWPTNDSDISAPCTEPAFTKDDIIGITNRRELIIDTSRLKNKSCDITELLNSCRRVRGIQHGTVLAQTKFYVFDPSINALERSDIIAKLVKDSDSDIIFLKSGNELFPVIASNSCFNRDNNAAEASQMLSGSTNVQANNTSRKNHKNLGDSILNGDSEPTTNPESVQPHGVLDRYPDDTYVQNPQVAQNPGWYATLPPFIVTPEQVRAAARRQVLKEHMIQSERYNELAILKNQDPLIMMESPQNIFVNDTIFDFGAMGGCLNEPHMQSQWSPLTVEHLFIPLVRTMNGVKAQLITEGQMSQSSWLSYCSDLSSRENSPIINAMARIYTNLLIGMWRDVNKYLLFLHRTGTVVGHETRFAMPVRAENGFSWDDLCKMLAARSLDRVHSHTASAYGAQLNTPATKVRTEFSEIARNFTAASKK